MAHATPRPSALALASDAIRSFMASPLLAGAGLEREPEHHGPSPLVDDERPMPHLAGAGLERDPERHGSPILSSPKSKVISHGTRCRPRLSPWLLFID